MKQEGDSTIGRRNAQGLRPEHISVQTPRKPIEIKVYRRSVETETFIVAPFL